MKFAESWLREWVNPDLDAAAIGVALTMAGHELDGLVVEGAGLDGVVVAEVLSAEPHPDADRLRVCQVSSGKGDPVQIVCGAPNARAGMKAALASPGTKLPNGLKLKKAKIRGVESHGMLCSATELGLGDESDGIIELPQDAPVGETLAGFLGLPDAVFDVDLTPNRGDCFSVLGIARDLSAQTATSLSGPDFSAVEAAIKDTQAVDLIEPDVCPRFAGRVIRGIDPAAQTPLWLTERLRRSGIRAIHPVVDITNYVMLELGQPLHAYDCAKLDGTIRPRLAKTGEKLTLLDERDIALNPDTVVITDDSGAIGMAGIMGGLSTAVTDATRDVFFEAAFWPQEVMAGRARSYGMHTDASLRFERGVDPELPPRAIERATQLLLEIAGGKAGPAEDHVHEELLPRREPVALRRERLHKLLGVTIADDTVTRNLQGLQFDVDVTDDGWRATPPSFRFDIVIEEDLVEEVARVYGYDQIDENTAVSETPLEPVAENKIPVNRIAEILLGRDFQEVITWSFVDAESDQALTGVKSPLVLSNPISTDLSVMRGTLWTGLLHAARSNLSRQQERVRLFEIGRSYHGSLDEPREVLRVSAIVVGSALPEQWGTKTQAADFFDLKGDLEALIGITGDAADFEFVATENVALQPGQAAAILRGGKQLGLIGKLHPAVARKLDFKKDAFLFELDADEFLQTSLPAAEAVSRFPAIRRDLAIVVGEAVSVAQIRAAVEEAAPGLVREVTVFDVYRGAGIEAGLKSIAFGLILQETSRTLTDADADAATHAAIKKLQQK
ncbi:MAG: phenylalanine--tRNA ligase subunit beta, partial [Woeseia sp.]|nr:phenylalanine--tRNA ligase subunit beta [Woeseia sp.]